MSMILIQTSLHLNCDKQSLKDMPPQNRHGIVQVRKKDDLCDLYDVAAEHWVRDEPWVRDELISWDWIVETTKRLASGGIVLDCGCGTGNLCRPISVTAAKVIGIDSSDKMIHEAQRRTKANTNVRYVCADMRDVGLYVEDHTTDLCLSIFGFCCLPTVTDVRTFISAMHKTLRPGGYAIMQVPHPLDGFFNAHSSWALDETAPESYFDSGNTLHRRLKTATGDVLRVGRHHFTLSDYFNAIIAGSFELLEVIEPKPSAELLTKFPDLAVEARLPSSLILLCRARPR